MKNCIIIFFIFFMVLTSCKRQLENSIETTLYTKDSVYKITFDKPIELDSFYEWFSPDDTKCTDLDKYRFSKKNFPKQQEGGFVGFHPDSAYCITISHAHKFRCKTQEINDNPSDYLKLKTEIAKVSNETIDTLFAKKMKINGAKFNIGAYKQKENYKNGYWTYHIRTVTVIDSNLINFDAECRAKDCKGFIERMEKSFQTINIEKIK